MDEDTCLHAELESRIARFGKTNPITAGHDKVIDTTKLLSDLEEKMKSAISQKNLHLCQHKWPCKCRDPASCVCDDDEYVTVASCKADLLSNCLYSIHMTYSAGVKLDKKQPIRCFTLPNADNKEEHEFFDVRSGRREFQIENGVVFALSDEATVKFQSLIVTFNYMDYREA